MKQDLTEVIERYKIDVDGLSNSQDATAEGVFIIPWDSETHLQVFSSELREWDRLSVIAVDKSRQRRKKPATREPSLKELRHVSRYFFDDDERKQTFVSLEERDGKKYAVIERSQVFIVPRPGDALPEQGTELSAPTEDDKAKAREVLGNMFGSPDEIAQ